MYVLRAPADECFADMSTLISMLHTGLPWLSECGIMAMQEWQTVGEVPKKEWMESVQLVFDYFCERTPRSFVEARDTSVVWNYKYAGKPTVPFDMCQSS